MSRIILSSLVTLLSTVTTIAFAGAKIHKIANPLAISLNPVRVSTTNTSVEPQLKYFGGPIIANIKVVSVFWGARVDSFAVKNISDFYKTLVTSSMVDMLQEYNTDITTQDGKAGTNQKFSYGTSSGDFQITPANTKMKLTDTDVQAEIKQQIIDKHLPTPDANTLYMVHFPPGSEISMVQDGQTYTSCQAFCAYHNSFHGPNNENVFYGVMPSFKGNMCHYGCGNGTDDENFTSAASHEVIEAMTDAQVGDITGNDMAFPGAWYDDSSDTQKAHGEIGDICAQSSEPVKITSAKGVAYAIQQEWSNKHNTCTYKP